MNYVYPRMTIYFAFQKDWNIEINGLSLQIIQKEIDACLRRLMKGTNHSLERDRLIKWFDQLMAFMPAIINDCGLKPLNLSSEMTPEWMQFLRVLAQSLSKEAIRPSGFDRIPPFLSAIWGHQLENSSGSASYSSTVRKHLEFLNEPEYWNGLTPSLLKMLDFRKNMFQIAQEKSLGIIECVGDLFERISHE